MSDPLRNRLAEFRALAGLTQEELAALADVTPGTVSRAENGAMVSLRIMGKLSQALGHHPSRVFPEAWPAAEQVG